MAAQTKDSLKINDIEPVVVSTYKDKAVNQTSVNIISLNIDSLQQYGNFNLTDLMTKTPGISMLSTGVAINKPVIRGLYGNRVLMLIGGLKFDNQQWQEEHGLGLSDFGISKVEIIKGPMSVLYGSEAIGGIINVVDEERAKPFTKESNVGLRMNSNTTGGLFQAGYKTNNGKHWQRIRIGIENHADYTDGNNNRVLNSRFDGYNLKAGYGFIKKNWVSNNSFLSTFNRYGFIFNDVYTFIDTDKRWSRKLDVNPAHLVLLNILSSENKLLLKNNGKLNINLGIQSNERMENEGGGAISLNMHLLTFQYLIKYEKQLNTRQNLILSHLGSFENNTNFGARKIVPDANMQESNLSAYLESTLKPHFIIENGMGIGQKWIKTAFTPSVNGPQKEVQPFNKFSPYFNIFSGFTFFKTSRFNAKANVATGVRIPNLAELSSNGLHEGVFTYEIGNPKLKNEQNIALNVFTNFNRKYFSISVSPFVNYFFNYVYLAPTTESWFGFPVFRYRQQNALQYGTELSINTQISKQIAASAAYSGMISKTNNGEYTPFVPAQKITVQLNYALAKNALKGLKVYSSLDYNFAQNNTAPDELKTPNYFLWNAGLNKSFTHKNNTYSLSIAANNILNKAYYDHLSRFKYFGLLNIGRNISINFNIKFASAK